MDGKAQCTALRSVDLSKKRSSRRFSAAKCSDGLQVQTVLAPLPVIERCNMLLDQYPSDER